MLVVSYTYIAIDSVPVGPEGGGNSQVGGDSESGGDLEGGESRKGEFLEGLVGGRRLGGGWERT